MTVLETQLLDAARNIGPVLREAGEEGERERRLPARALMALKSAGLHRMLLPKSLGGFEVDPVTCARVVEEVAGFDSAAAWVLQNNSGAWWAARLPEEFSPALRSVIEDETRRGLDPGRRVAMRRPST